MSPESMDTWAVFLITGGGSAGTDDRPIGEEGVKACEPQGSQHGHGHLGTNRPSRNITKLMLGLVV